MLVCWAAMTEHHGLGGLNNKFISSRFWRLRVQGAGVERVDVFQGPSP